MGEAMAAAYVADRRRAERAYRRALRSIDDDVSFVYATVVGFNSMAPASEYPGFTYYFRLRHQELNGCLFGTVTGDPSLDVALETGKRSLERCLTQWAELGPAFVPFEDPIVGLIEPRIEVIIPFAVRPELYYPEAERRRPSTPGTAPGA